MLAQPGDNMLKGSQTPGAGHLNPSFLWARTSGMLHHELTRSNTSTTLPSVLDHDALNRAIWSLANSGPDKSLNAGNLVPNGLDGKALERTDAHGCCVGLATFGPKVGHVSLGLPRFPQCSRLSRAKTPLDRRVRVCLETPTPHRGQHQNARCLGMGTRTGPRNLPGSCHQYAQYLT